ncbi:MAG: nucleotidyltransferase family protein [Pseudomonadota bacterium]
MKADRAEAAFKLMLACTHWSQDPAARRTAIAQACETLNGDWGRFAGLIERHHLIVPAVRSLRDAGIEPPEHLAEAASATQTRALRLSARSVNLLRMLDDAGIAAMLMKGPVLSDMVFADPAIRHSSDIDILVEWENFASAIAVLEQRGLKLHKAPPPQGSWRLDLWRTLAKDVALFDPESGCVVELHHRLKSPDALLPGLGFADAKDRHSLGGMQLRVFAPDDLFVYLCAHGSTSLWHRLKWVADIHALVARHSAAEVERMQARSWELGTQRCTALALLVVHELWGCPLPQSVAQQLRDDSALQPLREASLGRLCGAERRYTSIANTLDRRHLAQLRRDAAYRRALRREFVYDRELLERFHLNERVKWLYFPLRIALFVQRKLGLR